MYFENAHLSKESSMQVSCAIQYFVDNLIVDKYFKLVAINDNGDETELLVRPLFEQDFYINADRSQLMKCIALDGRRVDVLVPRPEIRNSTRALVIIESLTV